jgi:hypothetical protein
MYIFENFRWAFLDTDFIYLLTTNNHLLGLFKVGFPKKRKKDFRTFVGLFFVNNIYLKQIYVRKIELSN